LRTKLKKAEKEIELLDRKTEIENRDIKEEFQTHMEVYKKQLESAWKEIYAASAKGCGYELKYDPPNVENKKVKPGYVTYKITPSTWF